MGRDKPVDDAVIVVLQLSPPFAPTKSAEPDLRKVWTFHSSDAYFAHAVRHETIAFLRTCGIADDDLTRCELIIGELLANTVQHAPGIVRLDVDCEGPRPIVSVADMGPGLFEYSTHLPVDDLNEDGRGLYLIKTLAERMHVTATPGAGTTITVALPVRNRDPLSHMRPA